MSESVEPDTAVGRGRSLRVLHVGPTPFFSDRGCHIRIRGLVTALARGGIRSRLCTYHHGREVEGVETSRIVRIPGYDQVDAGPAGFKYLADVLLFFRVGRELARWRPDVVHGHLHEGALLGWAASKVMFWRRTPVIFDMQGSLVGELEEYDYFERRGYLRRVFESVERFIDHLPDAIACSSAASLSITRDRFGVPAEKLHVIQDGVGVDAPEPARANTVARRLGLPRDTAIAVYSGSLLAVKGLDALHSVMRQSVSRGLPLHFLLVGYPTDQTKRFLAQHGLEAHCTLAGRVPFEAIGDYLGLATVALEPKVSASGEASGKLLNYMAAGLPVACFDTPNNRQMLGDAGCYASADSPAAIVDALESLLRDPGRCQEIGRRGRARVESDFSWDASADKLAEIYRSVLHGRKAG